MARFRVWGTVTGRKYLGVFEADTKEAAEDMALKSKKAEVCFCHQCSDECENAEIHEADAEEMNDDKEE